MFTPPSPYSPVLDRQLRPDGQAVLVVPSDVPVAAVLTVLDDLFARDTALVQIDLEVDGELVGATSHYWLAERNGTLRGGPAGGLGAGDGATLQGESANWVQLVYACQQSGCAAQRFLLIDVDGPDGPPCPNPGHGPMRRQA